jgi:dTDP-4-amino-4,6-dideoxygalactose transaminase
MLPIDDQLSRESTQPTLAPSNGTAGSGDGALLSVWRGALDAWGVAGSGSTSSVTGGGAVAAFEGEFSGRVGGRPCLAVGSGSAALVVALASVGVAAGCEVVTSVLDWPAARQAIRLLGARPVLVDVDPDTWTLSPAAVAAGVTPRTRAVVATHLFGIPADVPGLREKCGPGVAVVEDCAQALGASLDGVAVGALGDAAAFSLGPGKHLDAGEGGVVVFAGDELFAAGVGASQHRVRQLKAGVLGSGAEVLSSRIHPMAAVLAWHRLALLDADLDGRRVVADLLMADLRGRAGVRVPRLGGRYQPAWWRVPIVARAGAVIPEGFASVSLRLPGSASTGVFPHARAVAAGLYWLDPTKQGHVA